MKNAAAGTPLTTNLRGARAWVLFLLLVTLCCCEVHGFAPVKHERKLPSSAAARNSVSPSHEQGVRRVKNTKGSSTNSSGTNNSGADPSASNAAPLTLTATGLKMMLSGVDPLEAASRMTWQDTTRDFIEADMLDTQKGIDKLQVNVYFDRQDPPNASQRRKLRRSLNRLLQQQALSVIFDVDMTIESKDGNHNAFNHVTNAFSTDEKRALYIQKLKATGDPAFASASMDTNLVSTASGANGKKIGIIVGVTILVLIIFAGVAFVLHGNKANATTTQVVPEVENDKDDEESQTQPEESPRTSPQLRPSEPRSGAPPETPVRNGVPRTVLVDDSSQYFDGNVSVGWSVDTENYTQISNLT